MTPLVTSNTHNAGVSIVGVGSGPPVSLRDTGGRRAGLGFAKHFAAVGARQVGGEALGVASAFRHPGEVRFLRQLAKPQAANTTGQRLVAPDAVGFDVAALGAILDLEQRNRVERSGVMFHAGTDAIGGGDRGGLLLVNNLQRATQDLTVAQTLIDRNAHL